MLIVVAHNQKQSFISCAIAQVQLKYGTKSGRQRVTQLQEWLMQIRRATSYDGWAKFLITAYFFSW